MFGRGMIVNNKIVARHHQDIYAEMVEQTKQQHRQIHAGLISVLFKFDEDAQTFLNECEDYPFTLPIGNVKDMEKIFSILSERINMVYARHLTKRAPDVW